MLHNSSCWYSSFTQNVLSITHTVCREDKRSICVTHRLGKYLTPRWLCSVPHVTMPPGAALIHILTPCSELSRREVPPPPTGQAEQPLLAEIHTKELEGRGGLKKSGQELLQQAREEQKPANYLCILLTPFFLGCPDALCKSLPSSVSLY